ncbi:MAG: hypothetical protein IKY13_00195 [Bacteroidaceae bacterium]|nr:hypothetical protein [Bacteroidaceae bacterium]
MNKSILQVLKMILALAGGGAIGLTIALLFTGTSINELITKFSRVDWAETVGAGVFSILAAFAALDKDIHSKKAFINQLTIHAHTQQGTRPRDIPNEYLTFTTDINFNDALQVNWLLMSAVTLMDRRDYETSHQIWL